MFKLLSNELFLSMILLWIILLLHKRKRILISTRRSSMKFRPLIQRLVLWWLNGINRCGPIPDRQALRRNGWCAWYSNGVLSDSAIDSCQRPSKDCDLANGLHKHWILRTACRGCMCLQCFEMGIHFLFDNISWFFVDILDLRNNGSKTPRCGKQDGLLMHMHLLWSAIGVVRDWLWGLLFLRLLIWDAAKNNHHAV